MPRNFDDRLIEFSRAVRESTLKRLRRVPPGYESWRITPRALSFADVAGHLVDADEWLAAKLADPALEPMVAAAGTVRIDERRGYEELLERLAAAGERRAELLAGLDAEALAQPVFDRRFGGEVSVWWVVVRGNLDHEIHHRGQVAAYLRVLEDEGVTRQP